MSDEARNVELLRKAYGVWSETRGGSADHWLEICADRSRSARSPKARRGSAYLTAYQSPRRR